MPQLKAQIDIEVPRADVFRFCHDLQNWQEWADQIEAVEMLTPKPLRRGTLLRIDARQGGGAVYSWEAEVVDYQMPSASRVKAIDTASSCPFAAGSEMVWEFESSGAGTRFKWTWKYSPRGIIASIFDFLGRRSSTQKAMRRSMSNLKTLIESGRRAHVG